MENIVTQCALAEGLPRTMADPYQLQQVVLNLIVNAEHALLESRGHGHIWIRTARSTKGGHDWIVVVVSDDGPGISQEISSKVFDPFFTTKPAGTGTGLGLSIVYGIIHQHHGEISFESHPGQGTKFLIELPVVAAPEQKETFKALTERYTTAITGRILVVEDEPTVGKLIVDVLREEGHEIEAVLDSHEGLARLSCGHYDLVICDLRMPLVDGYAFYEALVRSGSPMQRHIIFVTGDVLAPRTLEFLVSRGLPYLAKPFLVEELKLAVKQALNGGDEENHDAGPELGPKGLGGTGMAEQIG
jgi:two-component system NtrC family sensor kinase